MFLTKADLDGLNSYLLDSNFSECFHSASVEHIWATIKQTIYNALSSQTKVTEEKLQAKMRSAKSDYKTNLIQSFANRNSSKIYKYIRGITRQNSIPPTFNFESSSATSDRDI